MADQVQRVSPLWQFASRFSSLGGADRVSIREVPYLTQLTLRVDPSGPAARRVEQALGTELPTSAGTTAEGGDVTVLWLGPDEWLVTGPPDTAEALTDRLNEALAGDHGAVVDTSAQRTGVRLTGTHVREVLAQGCSLDLDPSAFGPGRCAQTLLAKAQVVLVAERDGVLVLVRSSFAGHLATWLLDAATEYAADSFPALERSA